MLPVDWYSRGSSNKGRSSLFMCFTSVVGGFPFDEIIQIQERCLQAALCSLKRDPEGNHQRYLHVELLHL